MQNVDLTVFMTMGGVTNPHLNNSQLIEPLTDMMGGF